MNNSMALTPCICSILLTHVKVCSYCCELHFRILSSPSTRQCTWCHSAMQPSVCSCQVLTDLAKKVGASKVFCHSEVTYEEDLTEKQVAAALKVEDIQLKASWGSTLYSPDDLPFKLGDLPATHGPSLRLQRKHPDRQRDWFYLTPGNCQSMLLSYEICNITKMLVWVKSKDD